MTPYTKQIVELHKIHKAIENCGCNKDNEQGGGDENSGNLLMSLIPNQLPKPTLFLYRINDEDNNPIDVTNYTIDDLINIFIERGSDFSILCLYENSDLHFGITKDITFGIEDLMFITINQISGDNISANQIYYNNKVYYYYSEDLS